MSRLPKTAPVDVQTICQPLSSCPPALMSPVVPPLDASLSNMPPPPSNGVVWPKALTMLGVVDKARSAAIEFTIVILAPPEAALIAASEIRFCHAAAPNLHSRSVAVDRIETSWPFVPAGPWTP